MDIKKIILCAALVLAGFSASAQHKLGVKAGGNMSWIPGTTIYGYENVVPHFNFYAGATYEYQLSDSFAIQPELLYARKGYRDNNDASRYKRTLAYVELPVLASFKMLDDRFAFMLGPEFGYLVSATTNDKGVIKDDLKNCNPFEFSIVLQACYMIIDNLGIELKVDYGLTRVIKQFENVVDKGRNLSLELGVCYKFEL